MIISETKVLPMCELCVRTTENVKTGCHLNVSNIEEYMKDADLAISAGGITLYELCAVGTPTISYLMADNQSGNTSGFERKKIIPFCGDIRNGNYLEHLMFCIDRWLADQEARKTVSGRMQELVDGQGVYRICDEIRRL